MPSTIAALLKHPDPVERALALTHRGVTPQDVALAEQDPHPRVQAAVSRWKLQNQPAQRVHGFVATHGLVNGAQGPQRAFYLSAGPEHLARMGSSADEFTRYSHAQHRHLGHFAPDVLGRVIYSGEPGNQVVVHSVHAPHAEAPGIRGANLAHWLNDTFHTDHDPAAFEAHGNGQLSELAHRQIHRLFGGHDPRQVVVDAFGRYAGSGVDYSSAAQVASDKDKTAAGLVSKLRPTYTWVLRAMNLKGSPSDQLEQLKGHLRDPEARKAKHSEMGLTSMQSELAHHSAARTWAQLQQHAGMVQPDEFLSDL